MKSAILLSLLSLLIPQHPAVPLHRAGETAQTTLCFKSGEQPGGMTKICYYDCLGSTVVVTIAATQICPLTINR